MCVGDSYTYQSHTDLQTCGKHEKFGIPTMKCGDKFGSIRTAHVFTFVAGVSSTVILRDEAWSLMGRPSTSAVCVEEQYNPTPRSWFAEACVEAASEENPVKRLLASDAG